MKKEIKIFNNLTEKDYQNILSHFKQIHFDKKEIIEFGDSSHDYIYLVKMGRVKVSYLSPEGKEIIVTILQAGDIYSMHSEATTTVLESAEILYIELEIFKKIALENQILTGNLFKILGTILKNTNDALLNLAFKEVNSRLASLLLKMVQEKGTNIKGVLVFELGLTHEEIANLISSTRQTVTTVLKRFERAGIIGVEKKKISVKEIDELILLSKNNL